MKVIVGSKNKDKVKIVENALKNLHLEIDVDSVGVDSGIADQSLDREITKKRAINRAENARKSKLALFTPIFLASETPIFS